MNKLFTKVAVFILTFFTLITIHYSLITVSAQERTLALDISVTNPSDTETKEIEVRADLPEELTKEDIISSDGLELDFDEEKGFLFVKGKVLLQPAETTFYRIVVRDVWIIPGSEGVPVGDIATHIAAYREHKRKLSATVHKEAGIRRQKRGGRIIWLAILATIPAVGIFIGRRRLLSWIGLGVSKYQTIPESQAFRAGAASKNEKTENRRQEIIEEIKETNEQENGASKKQPIPESQAFGAGAASEVPEINLKETKIEPDVIEKVPAKFVWHYKFMPVRLEKDVLTVACANPDSVVKDDLSQFLGYKVKMARADEADILEAIKKFYGVGAETVEKILEEESVSGEGLGTAGLEEIKEEDIAKLAEEPGIIKLVNQILLEANQKNATDIHIEPYPGKLKLRYRIDGVLYDAKVPSDIVRFLPAIVSRVKIMSGLNIVERRLPQDGRAKVKIKNEVFDLRISTMPTPHGESIVIRVLPTTMLFSLEKLGFSDRDLKVFEELIKKPHGIIFVTGPTGSGKTTTLYAALSKIRQENKGAKILTIEDPIEYELEGITQTQVNPEINLTFARGLRSMLRHDPDIMMVGEVRDFETAEIAIRMALTGHLLFSTLHTNDAASGVTRLLDIGVEPYLVASSVEAFIAQRLVRVVCKKCKGKGCEGCNLTGYRGRTAIFELLLVDEAIKKLIIEKAPSDTIRKKAVSLGMKTLWEDGEEKIKKEITTREEVLRVTQEHEWPRIRGNL